MAKLLAGIPSVPRVMLIRQVCLQWRRKMDARRMDKYRSVYMSHY